MVLRIDNDGARRLACVVVDDCAQVRRINSRRPHGRRCAATEPQASAQSRGSRDKRTAAQDNRIGCYSLVQLCLLRSRSVMLSHLAQRRGPGHRRAGAACALARAAGPLWVSTSGGAGAAQYPRALFVKYKPILVGLL